MTYHGKKWSRKGLHCAALFIALGTKNADVGKIAVIVGIVQPVADDELVRISKPQMSVLRLLSWQVALSRKETVVMDAGFLAESSSLR